MRDVAAQRGDERLVVDLDPPLLDRLAVVAEHIVLLVVALLDRGGIPAEVLVGLVMDAVDGAAGAVEGRCGTFRRVGVLVDARLDIERVAIGIGTYLGAHLVHAVAQLVLG